MQTTSELPKDWRKFHLDNVRSLDRAKVLAAADFLRSYLTPATIEQIKAKAEGDPEWWTGYHLGAMMGLRNALRSRGFGEKELGVANLDDYAVGLLEFAIGVTELDDRASNVGSTFGVEQIARVCHEANESYCHSIGDHSQRSWDEADEWQRQSAIAGVRFVLANPKAPASASHEAWLRAKAADGWKYGPIKDDSKKEHPCMVPYAQLPCEERVKDYLFQGIVRAFLHAEHEL